jgi:hypothetical protein
MALIAIDVNHTVEVELDLDPDKGTDNATKWGIAVVSPIVLDYIKTKNNIMQYDPNKPDEPAQIRFSGAGNLDLVRHGLKTVSNFLDTRGEAVALDFKNDRIGKREYRVVSDKILEMIHPQAIDELAAKIQGLTPGMTKRDAEGAESDGEPPAPEAQAALPPSQPAPESAETGESTA